LTLRERQRQVREDAILDVAHDMLVGQGYDEMSMDDLAARVGISKATLYQHFDSKEELAINVIVRAMRQGEDFIASLDPALTAIERLGRVLRDAIEKRATFGSARLMLPPRVVMQHPRFQEQSSRLISAIGRLVDAAKDEGTLAPQFATPVVVRMLLTCMRETGYADLLARQECTLAELSDTLISILFDGLRTRPLTTGGSSNDN
jgi:AcrR family transcriptional regulator